MKKMLFITAIGMLSSTTFAQNGFYCFSSVGAGMSNVNQGYTFGNQNGNTVKKDGVFSYNAKIGIGYQLKNWRIQTGLQYSTSGYKLKGSLFGSDFDPINPDKMGTSMHQLNYSHIGIPLQVGYVIRPEKKFSIVPQLGILTTYNMGAKSSTIISGGEEINNTWTKESFEGRYNRVSLWGTAAVQLEYKLSKRISLIGGPSIQYMISNYDHNPVPAFFKSEQRNYTINFDIGLKIKL